MTEAGKKVRALPWVKRDESARVVTGISYL
jgi:hypothetical protein